jgi:hypothetical protein
MLVVLAVERHGARVAEPRAAHNAVAAVAPRAPEAASAGPRPNRGLAFETLPVAAPDHAVRSPAAAAPAETQRHRRHRHRHAIVDDRTLPPTNPDGEQRADAPLPRFGQF